MVSLEILVTHKSNIYRPRWQVAEEKSNDCWRHVLKTEAKMQRDLDFIFYIKKECSTTGRLGD